MTPLCKAIIIMPILQRRKQIQKQSHIQGHTASMKLKQDLNLGFKLQIQSYFYQVIVASSHQQYTQVSEYV